jgi:hypothetical protein
MGMPGLWRAEDGVRKSRLGRSSRGDVLQNQRANDFSSPDWEPIEERSWLHHGFLFLSISPAFSDPEGNVGAFGPLSAVLTRERDI